jgi:hypothetical protein
MGFTVENFSLDGKIPISRHLLQMWVNEETIKEELHFKTLTDTSS